MKTNNWLCIAYYMLIYLPFTLYCGKLLYKNRKETFFTKRNVILCAATLISQALLNGMEIFFNEFRANCWIKCDSVISHNIKHLIYLSILDSVIIIPILRYYLLYFNLKWSYIISHTPWWQHINEDKYHEKNGTNFFLKNKNTCIGSFQHMQKFIIIFYIISIISKIIIGIFSNHFDIIFILTSVYLIVSVIFIFIIHLLLEKHKNDSFAIKTEMRYQLVIWFIVCTFYAGFNAANLFQYAFIQSLSIWIGLLASIIISYLTVLYPLKQMELLDENDEYQLALQLSNSSSNNSNNNKISWKQFIVCGKENFDKFMNHLVHEIATESALF
eukprot:163212_1